MPRLALLLFLALTTLATAAEPLRVFIRSGPKSHGPGAHDYPRFLKEWVPLLNERGAKATGGDTFPTAAQLAATDVLILHAQEAGNIPAAEDRANLQAFLQRGGGLLVIHAGVVSRDPDWFKGIVGGSWRQGTTRWLEGPMHLYFTDRDNPVTKDCSNWSMDDEIYYDLDLLPAARVLATAYTPKAAGARNDAGQKRADELTGGGKRVSIYDIQPQMWMYERTVEGGSRPYRAFVSIPGHLYANFNRPNYRAILLRALAWAGQRANVDELCRPDELGDALRYVEGGPTKPSAAAAKIEVHPEFNLSLVASEPLINKVMNLDWDERGRLWVCETPEYPNGRRALNAAPWKDSGSLRASRTERDPEDRISILTDTDGDGIMDRKQVFADKLELVTSFVLYRNGVIAASAPDIWFLEDTDGDGVADRRTRLYTGLGIADTHAVINNLRWGQDGWIYATHGYSRGEVTSGDGQRNFGPANSGVVRFKPDGSAFEQYSSRGGNTWGLQVTWDGQVFWTQPTSGTVFFHTLLPESVLAKGKMPGTTSWKGMITNQQTYPLMSWPEQAYVQIDQVGRFTAAAGCAVTEPGAWPAKWDYSYFTGEPTLNIVHHSFVRRDGVSYRTEKEAGREETEFMRSRDLWFRPIETRLGPDGALYVVDFYNQAVIHNDTRGPQHGPANAAVRPDRDHYFSRIWKVQHKQAKAPAVPVLDRTKLPQLTEVIRTSTNTHVRQLAWRLVRENHGEAGRRAAAALVPPMGSVAEQRYQQGLQAATAAQRQDVLAAFAAASDDWTRSALIAAAAAQPAEYLAGALAAPNPAALTAFVTALLPNLAGDQTPALVQAAANAAPAALPVKTAILRGLAAPAAKPAFLDDTTQRLLSRLLQDPATMVATLPLAAAWDTTGALQAAVEGVSRQMQRDLVDPSRPDAARVDLAASLLAVPSQRTAALQAIDGLLAGPATPGTKTSLLALLGEMPAADTTKLLVDVYARSGEAAAFDQLLKRPEAALALLEAIRASRVDASKLAPGDAARLRTHPVRRVANEAGRVLATANPQTRQKDELIARLAGEVVKPGDAAKGRLLYTAACSVCHRLGDLGTRDVGPPLNGMGAHGPAELLVHIVDPNREVDPSFWQWNVTNKKGDVFTGVIVSENTASITLRNQGGDFEVKKDDIATRENTRRSLMPEGFENLGADGLRDLLAFVCGGAQDFRVLDLRGAYSADSRRGMFRREDAPDESVAPHKFGNLTVGGVPFFVMDPAKSPNGRNVVTLKGGPGGKNVSNEFPRRVTIPAPATAASVHFLGGVGGWAWPYGGDEARGLPALKVTVVRADGSREEHVLRNGEHFADYNKRADVPLSRDAGDLVRRGQLRVFALNLARKAELKEIELESFDNAIAPVTVAVTVGSEPAVLPAAAKPAVPAPAAAPLTGPKEGAKNDGPLPPVEPVTWEPGKTKVLIIGGGSSHQFTRFFGGTDSATLRAAGFSVHYTEDRDQAAAALPQADVAVISVNRMFFDTPAYRRALMAFAAAGKGVVMLHPGTWYGYRNWPELNARIVGGGARGHDKLGKYQVNAVQPTHPILAGVPASFEVEDELYWVNAEPANIPADTAPITVLAETSPSLKYQRPHPVLWITRHEQARIVGFTLGHDQRVHDLPAFQRMLANAVKWTSGQ